MESTLPKTMNADDVKEILVERKTRFVPHHPCSICRVWVGTIVHSVEPENLWFRSECECCSGGDGGHDSSLSDLADQCNMQTTDKGREWILRSLKGEYAA